MGFGGSIFLIALGAIIAFGVSDRHIGPLDLTVVGWVLMLAGLAGAALTAMMWNSRRTRTRTVIASPAPPPATNLTPPPAGGVVEERYTDRPY